MIILHRIFQHMISQNFTRGGVGPNSYSFWEEDIEKAKQTFLEKGYIVVILNNANKSESVFYPQKVKNIDNPIQ